jgi:1,2-phenylacetyl-CoA epoxidase catalytic subunit
MIYFKKIKKLFLKYWKLLVGGVLFLIGFFISASKNDNKVLKKDLEIYKKSNKQLEKDITKSTNDFLKEVKTINQDKKLQEESADKNKEENKKELLKDSKKLDKILKEKYGLNGE